MATAERAKTIRKASGLTQAAFATRYGIPKRTIENWEGGQRTAPDYVLDLLERCVTEDFAERKNEMLYDNDNGRAYRYIQDAVNDGEYWFEVLELGADDYIPNGDEVILKRRDIRKLTGGDAFLEEKEAED